MDAIKASLSGARSPGSGCRCGRRPRAHVGQCIVVGVVLVLLGFQSTVSAAGVKVARDDAGVVLGYRYFADPEERNRFSAAMSEGMLVLSDSGAVIKPSTAATRVCTRESPSRVSCTGPAAEFPPRIEFHLLVLLADGDDAADLHLPGQVMRVRGGDGNDRLVVIGAAQSWVQGGEGDDRVTGGPEGDYLWAGPGDDRLRDGGGDDQLIGDRGSDLVIASRGDDEVVGGPGADTLRGGPGDDRLLPGIEAQISSPVQAHGSDATREDVGGGSGQDTVQYTGYDLESEPVSVTLDGRANDGVAGERDLVRADIENALIIRGEAVGNGAPNVLTALSRGTLIGGGGADLLLGATNLDPGKEGNTRLFGGSGADRLRGQGRMYGGPGDDSLHPSWNGVPSVNPTRVGHYEGGPGNDKLREGLPPSAQIIGGSGDDSVNSRNNLNLCSEGKTCAPDHVVCGPGQDTVIADPHDIVAGDCETVTRGSLTRARAQLAPSAT